MQGKYHEINLFYSWWIRNCWFGLVSLLTSCKIIAQKKHPWSNKIFFRMSHAANARLFMEKNVTQWLSKFARRFTTRSSVAMLQPKSAGTCQSRSATRSTRGSARPWRRKSAKLFQGQSARRLLTGSVEASPSRNALMCPSSSVSR